MAGLSKILQAFFTYRGAVGVAGLIVIGVLLVLLQILRLSIFAPIGAADTMGLLSLIVRSVFWLAVTAVVVSGAAYVLPPSIFIPPAKVEYAVAVFRMIDPVRLGGIAAINDKCEPYVAFPYYSRESDHPSYWPARVWKDRQALSNRYDAYFGRADVQAAFAAARARLGDDSQIEFMSSAPGGADPLATVIASARMFFNLHLNGDAAALLEALGAPLAREFLSLEQARNELRLQLPNRIAILRIGNAGPRTARNITIDYEVAGRIYDTKLRAVAKDASEPQLPFEHRLTIPALLSGQAYDVTVWYHYQSVDERVFPDKINFIQELTQGFTISNIAAATGARVTFKPDLLREVPAYERLYDGDGRVAANPEPQLAALFKSRDSAIAASIESYEERHATAKDIALDKLCEFPVEEARITSIWVRFQSPAGKRYCAVCVYAHPSGPYVLLSSEDRERADFALVRTALARALGGEPETAITDRTDDICSTISMASGIDRPAIAKAFSELETAGFRNARVEKLNYDRDG